MSRTLPAWFRLHRCLRSSRLPPILTRTEHQSRVAAGQCEGGQNIHLPDPRTPRPIVQWALVCPSDEGSRRSPAQDGSASVLTTSSFRGSIRSLMSDQSQFLGREPGFDTASPGVAEGEMPRICHESQESGEPRVGKYHEFKGLRKRASGFEPPTSSLGSWHSTTELRPQPITNKALSVSPSNR